MLTQIITTHIDQNSITKISRNDLIDQITAIQQDVRRHDVINALRELEFEKYIISGRPIIFRFPSKTVGESMTQVKNVPVVKQVSPVVNSLEAEAFVLIDQMDATKDPSIDQLVSVEAYKRINEYIVDDQYPLNVFVYGESGVGKSTAILSLAKKNKRPVIRVNCSYATDVDDLFGGIRLQNDSTNFEIGPIVIAALTGSILLLDEIDTLNPRVCAELHNVLEHRAFFVKKLNKLIVPKSGFSIIATGNSKGDGQGSDRYVGVNVLSKALRERFSVFIEYNIANEREMFKILNKQFPHMPLSFINNVVEWHAKVVDAASSGVIIETIGVRRVMDLIDIAHRKGVNSATDVKMKKVLIDSLSIYEDETREGLMSLWDSLFCVTAPEVETQMDAINSI